MLSNLRNHSATQKGAWIAIFLTVAAGFEGFASRPYYDSVRVKTVCYGETAADHVDLNRTYTKSECLDLLAAAAPKYDAPLKRCLKKEVYDALPSHRHAALVSLAYNVGPAAVCRSSVVRDLNRGRVAAACDDFLKFDRGGGRVIRGLVNRRKAERQLCLEND